MALWTVLTAAFVLVLRDPGLFVYDAGQYWSGTLALTDGGDVYTSGALASRGALTPFIYVPAYLATQLGVSASWAVLVQNALLLGLLGAVVLPMLLRRVVTVGPVHIGVTAGLTALTLSGLAPYPLMDLAAVFAMCLGVLLVSGSAWWTPLLGGGCLAAAVNLRPAYTLPVLLIVLVVVATRWRRAPLALLGVAAVLAGQVAYGWKRVDVVSVLPPETGTIAAIQLKYAAYGTRYDTIPSTTQAPQLWHCSPEMAAATIEGRIPTTPGELLGLFIDTLPSSALFALHKVTGSLQWSWATPYADPGRQSLHPLGFLVVALSCVGLVSLIALSLDRRRVAGRTATLSLLALVVGAAVTLVGAAPEARFAAPAVVVGIVGSVAALARWHPRLRPSRSAVWWGAAALALSVAVVALGWQALDHRAPRGDLTAEVCRSL